MSRSRFKGPLISPSLTLKSKQKYQENIISNSSYIILPHFIGLTFKLYNGKSYTKIVVKENMVGYKFGEFLKTRKEFKHKK